MMDSHDTNQPLEQRKLEKETKVNEVAETGKPTSSVTATAESSPKADIPFASPEEILARLRKIAEDTENADKQEVDLLEKNFYILTKEQSISSEESTGNTYETPNPEREAINEEFHKLMDGIKKSRSEAMKAIEKEKEQNLAIKLSIIEKIKEFLEHPEDAHKNYNEFKALQKQWNDIKLIPSNQANELWKNYQLYTEKFYDIIKLNNEFREYDLKKNLEIKTGLCEAAEKLAAKPDVVSAFHQLQKLHQEFRETGPVAKDLREGIWERFKTASSVINRRHQQHTEALKEQEQMNLDAKTAICEIIEAIDCNELTSMSLWAKKTQEIIALQAKWKTIGFAPQKANTSIFERFRRACDLFFNKKEEFFKKTKENYATNLEKKIALCEKAESLKDSTDWKTTAEILTKIQQEWKTIGPVPKKQSDAIWKRFISACDYFFEQKGKATSSQRSVEKENLEKKKELIQRLANLNKSTEAEDTREEIRGIMQQWNSIGHVPYKDKDTIYKQYRNLIDKHFDRLHISISDRRLNEFKSSINSVGNGEDNSLYREREKLIRSYENMKSEIQTYENNLGFLTSSTKKGNSLVTEVTRKIEKLKDELTLIQKKIEFIEKSLAEE